MILVCICLLCNLLCFCFAICHSYFVFLCGLFSIFGCYCVILAWLGFPCPVICSVDAVLSFEFWLLSLCRAWGSVTPYLFFFFVVFQSLCVIVCLRLLFNPGFHCPEICILVRLWVLRRTVCFVPFFCFAAGSCALLVIMLCVPLSPSHCLSVMPCVVITLRFVLSMLPLCLQARIKVLSFQCFWMFVACSAESFRLSFALSLFVCFVRRLRRNFFAYRLLPIRVALFVLLSLWWPSRLLLFLHCSVYCLVRPRTCSFAVDYAPFSFLCVLCSVLRWLAL